MGSGQGELSSIISWIIIGSSIRCIACYYLHPKSLPFCMGICFLPIRLFVYLPSSFFSRASRSSYAVSLSGVVMDHPVCVWDLNWYCYVRVLPHWLVPSLSGLLVHRVSCYIIGATVWAYSPSICWVPLPISGFLLWNSLKSSSFPSCLSRLHFGC